MKPLRRFEEFLEKNIVERKAPDVPRAKSLIMEAENRRRFISNIQRKIKVSEQNANYFIENTYDVLIELIRAKLLLDGFKSSGEGSHEAEVSYLRNLNFEEADVRFMNSLRYFRNGIKYYGEHFDKDYAEKVLSFMNKIYPKLKGLAKTKD